MKGNRPAYILFLISMTLLLIRCSPPRELEYRDFRNLNVQKLGIAQSTVKMDLIYYNPNNFSLQLKRTDLDIYVENTYLGHTTQELQITIPKRQEFSLPIVMDFDMKNLWKNAFLTTFNKEVTVKIIGSVKVGKANVFKSFPVNYEGKQQFSLF